MTKLCLILLHSAPTLSMVEQFLRTVRPTTVRATVIRNSFFFNLRTKCKEEIFIILITKVCTHSIRLVEFLGSFHFPLMAKLECVGCPLCTNFWAANVTHLPAMNGLFFLRLQLGCPCASSLHSLSSTLRVSSHHSQPGPSPPAPPASSL